MPDSSDTRDKTAPRSMARQLMMWGFGILLTLLVAILLLRVFIRPIPPTQEPPNFHFGDPCTVCHLVTEDAEPVDVE